MILREYQQRAIAAVRASYANGHRAPCVVAPTGSGKTILASEVIRLCLRRGRRVLFNVHREELMDQSADKLARAGITDIRIIKAARDFNSRAPVTIASVQTLTRWSNERLPDVGLCLFDECFPAGTLVDGRPIESVRVGDAVRSFNHSTGRIEMRAVRRLFCSRPSTLVTVHLSDGRHITCTAGHPFFNGTDYTPAANLKAGDSVYGAHKEDASVCGVHSGIPVPHGHPYSNLLGGVQNCETRCTAQKSDDAVFGMRKDGHVFWQGALSRAHGVSSVTMAATNRRHASNAQSESRGCAETGISRIARVDRVEIHERRGTHGFGPLCPDDLVYNIEVDGNHNYFADGVLVHNCHHVKAKTWLKIADAYRQAWLLGLTATPERADGSPLGDVFDDLIVVASVSELTELGHLVPCRIWAPPTLLETGEIAVSPVDAYRQHGEDGKAIAFCSTLERANAVANEFNAAGITAATIHGDVSSEMRRQLLSWFRDGQLRVLVSVHVLTEGFDEPSASVAILERKPVHAGTYLQMVGRVLRPSPGKAHATLIDLCGSSLVHGTPSMERTYALNGKAISKPERDAIRQCPTCGGVFLFADIADGACPMCGVVLPKRVTKPPRVVGVSLTDATGTDQLKINLIAAARRTRRSSEWVERAHAAITGRIAS